MIATGLRVIALIVAIAAIADPAFSRRRPVLPVVEVTVAPGAELLGDDVFAALQPRFAVAEAPVAEPAARVAVGDIPRRRGSSPEPAAAVPAFVVPNGALDRRPAIAALRAPRRAPLNARVPVHLDLVFSAPGSEPEIELLVNGNAVRSLTLPRSESTSREASLSFIPTRPGVHHLRVVARAGAGGPTAWRDAVVTVTEVPWKVLAYDPRPSWSATFVRRVLDRDPRFEVSTRVAIAPEAALAGSPARVVPGAQPAAADATPDLRVAPDTRAAPDLRAAADLAPFDVVIVGAPEELGADEVRILTEYMRGRGGSVVVLIDGEPGAATQLSGVDAWQENVVATPVPLTHGDGNTPLQASEVVAPLNLPLGATVLAGREGAGLPAPSPVVWQRRTGSGLLIVSGALDAWRFRAAPDSGFDEFWRRVIADAAFGAPPPVDLTITPAVGRPGDPVSISATLRDVALAGGSGAEARVRAWLEGDGRREPFRLWPAERGVFRAELTLPEAAGEYHVVVEDAGGERDDAGIIVIDDAVGAAPSDLAIMEAWATAHGGAVVPATRLGDLVEAVEASVVREYDTRVWHPMRSAWWILPFALALSGEWWIRRRRGER